LAIDLLVIAGIAVAPTFSTQLTAGPGGRDCGQGETGPVANGEAIIAAGMALKVPDQGIVIALAAAMRDTGMHNLANPKVAGSLAGAHDGVAVDHQALGVLAQEPTWGTPSQLMTPAVAAAKFFAAMRAIPGWEAMPPQQVAATVQRTAFVEGYALEVPAAGQFYRDHLEHVHAAGCLSGPLQESTDAVGASW
jgi:hypothetical protein